MENKKIYALTYCYEGVDDTSPYACTIAVSDDIEKLKTKMAECVAEDTKIDEDDEWNTECNFKIHIEYDRAVDLQHKKCYNLYAKYTIHSVELL